MSPRIVFSHSAALLPDVGGTYEGYLIAAVPPALDGTALRVQFDLAMPRGQQEELDARVARGERISVVELRSSYGVPAESTELVRSWLSTQGFRIDRIAPDGSAIYTTAPLSVLRTALQIQLVSLQNTREEMIVTRIPPSLPAEIGSSVSRIIGLQPIHKPSIGPPPRGLAPH
jgi:hypothetical protein